MKVKLIKTYTGGWLEVDDFKVSDFDIEKTLPKWSHDHVSAHATIVLTLKDDVKAHLKNVLGDPEEKYETPLDKVLYGASVWMKHDSSFKGIVIHVSNYAKLKNVRKAETRKLREQAAWDKIVERLEKYSDKWIDERIDSLNEQVRLNVERSNESLLHYAKSTLGWFDLWVEEADKKADNAKLIKEIDDLKDTLKARQQLLREKRNKAFLAAFEEENWTGPDPDNEPLPKEIVDLWTDMLTKNEAFVGGGRLIF